jgi:predicted metal-dependent hydrolase
MSGADSLHSIVYGKKIVHFRLRHSARKTLAISVHPDLSVTVTAPKEAALDQIKGKVRKRADWILRQQDYFSQFLPPQPQRQYMSGETHYYLGKQYRLKIEESQDEAVKLKHGRINVTVRDKSNSQLVAALLNEWLLMRARDRFQISLQKCNERLRKYRIENPQLRIRKMSKRWGSCTRQGVIYLNPELIKAPSHCIDYVVTHELCHVRHPHHGKEFYSLLSRVMPDWEGRKRQLEKVFF